MSPRPISRSDDLRRLVEEGYELEVRGAILLVHHVPYVTAARAVAYGSLLMALTLAGDATAPPEDHTAQFVGEEPCDADGVRLGKVINGGAGQLGGIAYNVSFSAKPKPEDRYRDHHHKVTAYVARLGAPARSIDPGATALTFAPAVEDADGSPFVYTDTATPRAGLEKYAARLEGLRVAIVGVGGTGSYILDLAAKTTVAEIHLFDGDRFVQHNAFRAPGAIGLEDLRGGRNKADFWATAYGRFRRGVVPHPFRVTAENVSQLAGFSFVFVAVDDGPSRDAITRGLEGLEVSFIDVGLGVNDVDDRLSATARISTGTPTHTVDRARMPVQPAGPENDYRHNIQIAELNALNATLAVLKWKRIVGVYADLEGERFSTFSTSMNATVNADYDEPS